jgi:hypothetical protein
VDTITKLISEIDALIIENKRLLEENKRLKERSFNNRPKLTEREVRDIRDAYRGGMSQTDLANNYGVNPSTVSRTVRGFYH